MGELIPDRKGISRTVIYLAQEDPRHLRDKIGEMQKENAELKQTLSYLCDKDDEVTELKQRWEDLGEWLEMGKQIGRINGHSKPFCEILVKMEELSKEKA